MPQIHTQIKRFPKTGRCGVFAWVFLRISAYCLGVSAYFCGFPLSNRTGFYSQTLIEREFENKSVGWVER